MGRAVTDGAALCCKNLYSYQIFQQRKFQFSLFLYTETEVVVGVATTTTKKTTTTTTKTTYLMIYGSTFPFDRIRRGGRTARQWDAWSSLYVILIGPNQK